MPEFGTIRSEISYHVHLVEHSIRVGVLLFAVLHRADESQPARNSCPRLPHSVDSRFGLYHVAVVLSFLRSPALHKFVASLCILLVRYFDLFCIEFFYMFISYLIRTLFKLTMLNQTSCINK